MDKNKYANEIGMAAEAVIAQWGNVYDTPKGSLFRESGGWGHGIAFAEHHDTDRLYWNKTQYEPTGWTDSITRLQRMASGVETLALYLAGQEFTAKVDGSIKRLKAISRALST